MSTNDRRLLRYSLVFVWLTSALASVWEFDGQSRQLLNAGGIQNPSLLSALILGGASVDAILGVLLWVKPTRIVFCAALAMVIAMTVVATIILPAMWLHPLGPLTKNLPIAAILYLLIRTAK